MRLLDRNKQTIYYALYNGRGMLTDSEGNYTGEVGITYSEPVKVRAYVRATQGSWTIASDSTMNQFGLDIDYDRTIQLEGTDWDIREDTVLWIDDLDTSHPYDYIVKRIGTYFDHTTLAVKKVR